MFWFCINPVKHYKKRMLLTNDELKIAQDEQMKLSFKRHIKMTRWYVGVYHTLHENSS